MMENNEIKGLTCVTNNKTLVVEECGPGCCNPVQDCNPDDDCNPND